MPPTPKRSRKILKTGTVLSLFVHFIPYLKDTECKCLRLKILKRCGFLLYLNRLLKSRRNFESNFPNVTCSCQMQLKKMRKMIKTRLFAGRSTHVSSWKLLTGLKGQNGLGKQWARRGSRSGCRNFKFL